jgi:FAD synthase
VKTYDFDGRMLTVPEIRERVPAISETAIRRHLKAGRCTKAAMLGYDVNEAYRRAGKKHSAKKRGWGFA